MKKFKVTQAYCFTLSTEVIAESEEEAQAIFDEIDTHNLHETYIGHAPEMQLDDIEEIE